MFSFMVQTMLWAVKTSNIQQSVCRVYKMRQHVKLLGGTKLLNLVEGVQGGVDYV